MYILFLFERFLSKTKGNQYNMVRFQYLALLIDSVKCPMKSNIEAIILLNTKWETLSFREKLALKSLRNRSIKLFENVIFSAEKSNSIANLGGVQLRSETYLFDIIKFDELLSRFQRTLRDIFILKRDFYNLIADGEVNLL